MDEVGLLIECLIYYVERDRGTCKDSMEKKSKNKEETKTMSIPILVKGKQLNYKNKCLPFLLASLAAGQLKITYCM